ncbi:MAG: NADP-dependent oxidoreductase [Pseudomonadota bacterium]
MSGNLQWRVARYVDPGETLGAEHFTLHDGDIPSIADGEFLVRTLAFGTSPAQRGYIDGRKADQVPIGDVMRGRSIAVVHESRHPDFSPGDWVNASTGWQQWSVQSIDRPNVQNMNVLSVQKVDNSLRPSTLHLGLLGSAAFTAVHGLHAVGELKAGNTVVVSAAAGGVGSVACRVAKLARARVVGVAGGPEKCRWVTDVLGADACIDYKAGELTEPLLELCPEGVDVFFDNVGGTILNSVLPNLAIGARVVICGYISTDYSADELPGPSNYKYLLRKRASMEGFVIWDHTDRFGEYFEQLRAWYLGGELPAQIEDVSDGIETLPDALRSLFIGANRGIRLVRVGDDSG